MKIDPNTDVLIIIDPQNDFCPGGALAVEGGDEIMGQISTFAERFKHVVLTQDWHPQNQISFASNHAGGAPFSNVLVEYGEQTLWPDHCVQGTPGAEFHPDLNVPHAEVIIRKGNNPDVDSYSAFFENDHKTSTGLGGWLKERDLKRAFFVGLAYDFCVAYSAIDAKTVFGLDAVVVKDLTRGIGLPVDPETDTIEQAERNFETNDVVVMDRKEIA